MIHSRRTRFADVPVLLVWDGEESHARAAVLWFHGLGADKDVHRPELERLARAGFLAVGVDAAGHGERRLPDLDERIAAPREQAHRTAIELAVATAAEVPALLRELTAQHPNVSRVGAVGISMGGYILYRALVEEPRIGVAVAILGSPAWPHPSSPHDELDAFARTELLSITAELDENVPPEPARSLHRRLAASRPHAVQRYVELAGGVHLLSEAHWPITLHETLHWLERLKR